MQTYFSLLQWQWMNSFFHCCWKIYESRYIFHPTQKLFRKQTNALHSRVCNIREFSHFFSHTLLRPPYLIMLLQINSSFFWNWCNVNPNKITKWDQLWFRGFVSIILNPFLRVFAISAFLKVIHAPKTSHFRYPENNLPTYIFSNPCNWDFP